MSALLTRVASPATDKGMSVKQVYIQVGDDKMPVAPCGFALWEGARFQSLNPRAFHPSELASLPLDPTTLVHGWVKTVHDALAQIGVPVPEPLDYPEELSAFLGRQVRRSTLGEVHRTFIADETLPVFIKPVKHKMFTGHTIERFRDLAETAHDDPEMPVWVSGLVDFVSEYRCFVFEGGLQGVQRYTGDAWTLPDRNTVSAMIRAYRSAPVAYGLDVGVTRDGRTLLVEVNDCYALGHYAFSHLTYTEMCVARWEQMTG